MQCYTLNICFLQRGFLSYGFEEYNYRPKSHRTFDYEFEEFEASIKPWAL
jgi:hypothetical protein